MENGDLEADGVNSFNADSLVLVRYYEKEVPKNFLILIGYNI